MLPAFIRLASTFPDLVRGIDQVHQVVALPWQPRLQPLDQARASHEISAQGWDMESGYQPWSVHFPTPHGMARRNQAVAEARVMSISYHRLAVLATRPGQLLPPTNWHIDFDIG